MSNDYFEYKVPHYSALRDEVTPPYQFDKRMLDAIDFLFCSPTHKWGKVFGVQRWRSDVNEMAQVLYVYIMYGQNNLNSIGGALDNIIPQICVGMWRRFLGNNNTKYGRDNDFDRYYTTHVKRLRKGLVPIVEQMQYVIRDKRYIMHMDDMVKKRQGVGLRERRSCGTHEGSARFEYYANTE